MREIGRGKSPAVVPTALHSAETLIPHAISPGFPLQAGQKAALAECEYKRRILNVTPMGSVDSTGHSDRTTHSTAASKA
jgi:hypothetical protein